MKEQKDSTMPFTNNFNKNTVEERIKSIMKKKITIAGLFITSILIVGTITIFGTSPAKETKLVEPAKEAYSIEPTKETILQENTSKSLATNTSIKTTSQEDGKERLFKKYKPVGLIYDTESHFLYFNNKPVRYFRDYYQLYGGDDQTVHNFGEVSFFNEVGTIDVYAVREPWIKSSEIIRNSDGSFDPGGQIVGIEICTEEEFNSRNIDEIKKDEACYTPETPYRGDIIDGNVYVYNISSESKATAIKSLDPIAIAKETYSIYEPFKLIYSEEQDCLFYNNQKVRYFFDMLASNGETFSGGNFKGALRQFNCEDGMVDVYAIRDFSKLDEDRYGELVEVKIYDEGDFDTRTDDDLKNKCYLDNQEFNSK